MKTTYNNFFLILFIGAIFSQVTYAQSSTYEARYDKPDGTQLVAVYIGAESCGPCHFPANIEAVEQMKLAFSSIADQKDWSFKAIGIALDHSPEVGFAFLQKNGAFDEIVVGNNWSNLGAELFIFGADDVFPAIPQVVFYTQETEREPGGIQFGERQYTQRLMLGELISWLDNGASWDNLIKGDNKFRN